ncbi:exophilin-5 [Elgaria multicarinata webbii]|uniref:exophilin-5 n=1 Tax=Elgaria multicarinata webbii TaxID=159646 RepID=UPI002FCD1806
MTRAPRGVDLSFLNEEEAKQIFQVLRRDSQLKRAEKERLSKLHKKKEDATGLPGVTGEWFEEIQKRKFQNDADVGRMLKQPLAHSLRKAKGNDSTNAKPSTPQIPQAQKHAASSILGGLRTPLASLFSSFRRSRRQHSKSQQQQQEFPQVYDHFAPGAHPSSKVEEMAKSETGESLLSSEPTDKGFDGKQPLTVEDSTCTWNEQLENELLRVLGNLDDQLAQEQRRDAANRKTSIDYGSKASEIKHYPSVPRASFLGGVQRNDRSMFLTDERRPLRANDEHKAFFRPRVHYETYLKRHRTEGYTYGDAYDRRCPSLKRGHSTHSLGRSSEGSLQLPSGQCSSGFGHKGFMSKPTVSRSYSLSSLARHESLTSVDQLSTASLQQPLENNRGYTARHYHPRRTPLSSIVWNTAQSPERPLYPDKILRTQSLMELGSTFEDPYPCSPQENTRYGFYRSNMNYRRPVPNTPHSLYIDKHTSPPCFDDQENYLWHQMERNSSKTRYRCPSFHGRKSFPSERTEEQLFRPHSHHYYNDEVFLPSDADSERIPTNLSEWQSVYAEKIELSQCENDVQSHVSEYMKIREHPEGETNKLFLKHAQGIQRCPAYGLSVPTRQTEYSIQRQNLLMGVSQSPSKTFLKHLQAKKNFKSFASEEVGGADQSGKVDNGDVTEERLRFVSGQVDPNSPTESQMSPPTNSFAADPQVRMPLKPLDSQRQTKSTSIRGIENTCFPNIQNRNGRRNGFDCARNSDLDQTPPPRLSANSTRASILQSLHQRGHQSEALKAFMDRRTPDNTCSPIFSRGPKILANTELSDSCTKETHRHNSFVRHATSNSITGSPSNSPPKSPVAYYTLPRKSASIGGSVISEKPISHHTRRIPFNRISMGHDSETLVSDRIENIYSNKGDKISSLSPASSSLSSSPKDVTCPQNPQTKDYCSQLTQDPKRSLHATNTIAGQSEKGVVTCSPDKAEIPMLSGCEETDVGNPLKQYKTTSTLTVSIEEDNVKYHELISVYYTLPRKHPGLWRNLFRDDTKKDTDPSSLTGRPQSPQKKYEVRIGLAAVAFSSSLEKADSSGKTAATPSIQQNSNASDDGNKEDLHILNPTVESSGASQSQSLVHNGESDKVTSDCLQGDPKPSVTEDESSTAVVNVCIGRSRSSLKEGSKIDTPLVNSLNSTNAKISLGNLAAASSVMTAKEESPLGYRPSTEPIARNNPHTPPSCLIGNSQEGKYTTNPEINTTVKSAKDQIRQSAEVKETVHRQCHIISIKGNGLQPRNESVRNGTGEALVSETKVCSDFQKQTLQVDGASTVHPVLQPNRSALEYAKTEPEEMPQNSLQHKICPNSHRTSIDNQNLNSKNDVTTNSQDSPDHSATENKVSLDCTKDKASDIEKRKNRSSIKNKLAAMYKTSRKFSSKKILSPKPHISNIFSQNDTPSLEISNLHSMLIKPDVPQSFLQTGNENQNQNSLSDEVDGTMLDKPENRKSQTNKGALLLPNEIRRPFTNLCNQKKESPSPRQSDKKIGAMQNSTVLFPKETVSKLCSDSQAHDESLENNSHSIFSSTEVADSNQKKKGGSNVGLPLFSPYSSEENSNVIKNYSKANICSLQKLISPTEHDHYQNIKHLKRLSNLNLPCVEPVLNPKKTQRERHFSETSYTQEPHDQLASGSNLLQRGSRYCRKFKSYSELLTCDENENWDPYDDSNRTSASRRVMYPSIEFGIFGKEQQQTFLDNIKKSLTEGRLWRPCLLKDSSFLRKQGGCSLNTLELLGSNFAEGNTSAEGSSPSEPVGVREESPAHFSDSDSDTTTDDEYYLTDNDKESEL